MQTNLIITDCSASQSKLVKSLVNEMYGIEYEKREPQEISKAIEDKSEVYVLAFCGEECVGFAGATLNNQEYKEKYGNGTVIDYVYVKENCRGLQIAYQIIKKLLSNLTELGLNEAIMQVQTHNKQRFLHYALSDKNILSSEICQTNGNTYQDQILLIKDLTNVCNQTFSDFQ